VAKELIREKTSWLRGAGVTRDEEKSARQDLERLEELVSQLPPGDSHRGLAFFRCSGEGFEQVYELPVSVKTDLVLDHDPYSRPLTVLLDQYPTYCVVLFDHRRARIAEWSLGRLVEVQEVIDDSEISIREGGQKGKEQKRIAQQGDEHRRQHYRRVGDRLLHLFRRHRFDDLVVGGHAPDLSEFEAMLHSSLQQRVAGHIVADPSSPPADVARLAAGVEGEARRRREVELVQRVFERARAGGLGVLGVEASLEALNRGQVHTLVVEDGRLVPGRKCFGCHHLSVVEQICPRCEQETVSVADVVDEAMDEAVRQHGEVHTVFGDELSQAGGVGALLRFKL
jgi:peptide chain release factor subunit 1